MNIGFDAKRIFYNETGLGNYSRTLVKLIKKNYPDDNCFLFTPTIRGLKPMQYKNTFNDCTIIEPDTFFDRMFSTYWRNFTMVKDLLKFNLDIYHGLSHEIPRNIEKTGIKTVVTIHDLIFLKFPELYKPWDVMIYKKKYLESCHRADAIIAISENTKNDIMEFLNIPSEKIFVIYQSAAPQYYTKIDKSKHEIVMQKYNLKDPYILYVGSLNKRKNLIPLIKAISLLKQKKIKLIIVGSGSEKTNLEKTAANEGVTSQVRFLNNVSGEYLPSLYAGAKMFVYPSIYEGFGIPIIESLLCKTPVITNRGSCFHEAAGEGGIYADVFNPGSIAEAIEFLLIDRNHKKLAANGFQHVKNFSSANFVKNTHDLYQSII
ncbi:MAG: glycosyltransferase family 4 protein [Spirochaetia bacterium]|nr:glycosyltransferase family 4 protein [Spirochaetia bacterium]